MRKSVTDVIRHALVLLQRGRHGGRLNVEVTAFLLRELEKAGRIDFVALREGAADDDDSFPPALRERLKSGDIPPAKRWVSQMIEMASRNELTLSKTTA